LEEVIEVNNQFYIRATSSRLDARTRVLKRGETFAICDRFGDIAPGAPPELGLYHEGTRFLSRLSLTIDGNRPLLLSSDARDDNGAVVADLTNGDVFVEGRLAIPRGTVHLAREIRVLSAGLAQTLTFRHYGQEPFGCRLTLSVGADFADIFEVRGTVRAKRGHTLPALVEARGLLLSYTGLDGVFRKTRILCDPEPAEIEGAELVFPIRLARGEEKRFRLRISCRSGEEERVAPPPPAAVRGEAAAAALVSVESGHDPFDDWMRRSASDLKMMITQTPTGPYPYAGVPWFCAPFGRDGIVTALEVLWLDARLARGVLGYLAENQADALVPERDAEPGKILHESRKGEMADLGEVPFGRYYGSVDSTPLFVILAAAYYERTADRDFLEALWPHVERALDWIDDWGDRDGDGFVEYFRQSPNGLVHQGWKDSQDAIFHEDGRLAEGPIAPAEVQGYVYAAWTGAASLAATLGDTARAASLAREAALLRERFDRAFWCEQIGSYALALDGVKRPCRVLASNAGHALWTGIAREERAGSLARTLFDEGFFSGWGIRTVAAGQVRYNPMSYHNGSVWPHDNALIAGGLARYGLKRQCARLLSSFLDLSRAVELRRLPELVCGFQRRAGEGPTRYPLACAPQSWSAAAVFLMLQACLGISVSGAQRRICFDRPLLPPFLERLRLQNLPIAEGSVDLLVRREGEEIRVEVCRGDGEIEIIRNE
jgi:glycogen debranching enzyme